MKPQLSDQQLAQRAKQWHIRHTQQDRYPYRWASVCQQCEDAAKAAPESDRIADPVALRKRNDLVLARQCIDQALDAGTSADLHEAARAARQYIESVIGPPATIEEGDDEPDRHTRWTNRTIEGCHGEPLHYREAMNAWTWGRCYVGFAWHDPNIQSLLPVTEVQ